MKPRLPYRLPRTGASPGAALLVLLLAAALASVAVTQWWAARFDHHPGLGKALVTLPRVGPVYSPIAWTRWRAELAQAAPRHPGAAAHLKELDQALFLAGLAALARIRHRRASEAGFDLIFFPMFCVKAVGAGPRVQEARMQPFLGALLATIRSLWRHLSLRSWGDCR